MARFTFSASERRELEAAYREAMQEPVPANYGPLGCVMLILLVLVMVAAPPVFEHLGVAPPRWFRIGFLVVTVLASLFLILFGPSFGTNRVRSRARESIGLLAEQFEQLSDSEKRRHAARIIASAYHSGGPWMVDTFDFRAAREELGAAIAFVEAVEQALIEDLGVYPVFTDLDEEEDSRPGRAGMDS